MLRRTPWGLVTVVFATSLGLGSVARADEPTTAAATPARRERLLPYRALETQAVAMTRLLPKPGFGFDGAFVFGWESFQARVGVLALGVLPFKLAHGEIGNVVAAGQGDLCVARNVVQHQVRMCAGGQGGTMTHQWKGFERPGRKATAWAAGTLKGDYRLAITKHFGVMGGVGIVVPFVGPSFRGYDRYGVPTPVVFPGPVGGFISLGTSVRW
jgi:hypothetical protein